MNWILNKIEDYGETLDIKFSYDYDMQCFFRVYARVLMTGTGILRIVTDDIIDDLGKISSDKEELIDYLRETYFDNEFDSEKIEFDNEDLNKLIFIIKDLEEKNKW